MKLIEHLKIWDRAPHNAFTDLCRFQDRWFCTFREAESHTSLDGKIRVLGSADGQNWESHALFESSQTDLPDLRDPKLCVTPDNRLMLTAAATRRDVAPLTHQTLAWFCADGEPWSSAVPIGEPNFWIWRITWHEGKCGAKGEEDTGVAAYATARDEGHALEGKGSILRLYRSRDGISFETVVLQMLTEDRPNESTLRFAGDRLPCLTRRESGSATTLLGQSAPPYTDWQWTDLGVVRLGGPNFIQLPDGRFVAGGRMHHGGPHMALCWPDAEQGKLEEFIALPSSGDCSYPGLVWHDEKLWISYYSSHEAKTSIYLAILQV